MQYTTTLMHEAIVKLVGLISWYVPHPECVFTHNDSVFIREELADTQSESEHVISFRKSSS